jgi:S-sulfo-L-cysteine synthase (O-acetyl-L-serine-dependent)
MAMPDPLVLHASRSPGLTDRIGDTPLVPIDGLEIGHEVEVLGKAEWLNPGGSVKDRAAWNIVREALERGALGTGRRLLDATSGNTGIAYAWIGAAHGFPVTLCVPANANRERVRLIEALGAEIVPTSELEGTDGAMDVARRLFAEHPDRYFYADQYSNEANWRAHYLGTAEEIWRQTEGQITHLVAGIGTSGTLVGTARRLRERSPAIDVIAVQPDGPLHVLEGLKHLATARRPAIYDPSVASRVIEVASEDAIAMAKRQARRGLLLGWSAAAALVAAERAAREIPRGVVVAILPDSAERYLSERHWTEAT